MTPEREAEIREVIRSLGSRAHWSSAAISDLLAALDDARLGLKLVQEDAARVGKERDEARALHELMTDSALEWQKDAETAEAENAKLRSLAEAWVTARLLIPASCSKAERELIEAIRFPSEPSPAPDCCEGGHDD